MSGPKKEPPMKVAEALAGYLARSGLGERLEQMGALDDWADRVGERIAAVAEPVRLEEGVLFVAVRSSAWLMELRMMEKDVLARLNEGRSKGRIRRIRFVQEGGEDGEDGEDGEGEGGAGGGGASSSREPRGWRRRGRR